MSVGGTALQRQFTVHVVDDDASIRSSLSRLFRATGHYVRAFESAQAYLAEASPEDPGCVVLDIRMPGMDGLTLQERMSDQGFYSPIVFVSAHGDISASVRAMKGGAVDFLEKPFEEEDLLRAVDRAIELDEELRERRDSNARFEHGLEALTSREYQVMTHVIAGKPNKVIARELDVSEKTIKVHRGRVMKKMEARSLADLVRMTERADIQAAKPHDSAGVV